MCRVVNSLVHFQLSVEGKIDLGHNKLERQYAKSKTSKQLSAPTSKHHQMGLVQFNFLRTVLAHA